jgi:Transposase protein
VEFSPTVRRRATSSARSTTLSERSLADSQAPMGYGTSRYLERMLASCGLLVSAELQFVCADDVPQGGVLCALPALLTEGLLRHTRSLYHLPPGYYPLESLFLYLALLALVRCPSLEQTRYEAPGEWGKLLGLDRLPEVRTLRNKIGTLCEQEGRAAQWQSRLAKEWMEGVGTQEADRSGVGLFYIDGHVRVYHGSLGPLPRLYVARQKLLLRGTTDYWVNGLGGQPFFVVTQPIHARLIAALREQVIPRLLTDAPQPDAPTLEADAQAMRFTIIFDREGFSPKFFAELSQQRIGFLTYHKYPKENWPAEEFRMQSVRLHTGPVVERSLAERGTQLSNGLWVREVRERSSEVSQSSILSNDRRLDLTQIAAWMPARWSQENFLKYMREHFGLDRLIEHGTLPLPEATIVVNPAHRRLDQQIRRERGRLQRLEAQFGAHTLPPQATARQMQNFEQEGGQLREKIQAQTVLLEGLKKQRQEIPRKVPLKDLPAAERYRQLCPESKHFIDTIKMIAYRAESALAGELREHLKRDDDARALLRRVFVTPANLRPDHEQKTLLVELHRLGSPLQDAAVAKLCEELTATETRFPTTDLRLVYRQLGSL